MTGGSLGIQLPTFSNGSANSAVATTSPIDTSYQPGDILSGKGAAKTQAYNQWILDERERAYNSAEAAANREFQAFMDSTQVQRRMADYKAAGLNPWLAVQNLNSSSVAGSSASSSSGQASAPQSRVGEFGTSALGLAVLIRTIAKLVK